MKIFKVIILYPISLIYGLVVTFRNLLFDIKIFKSEEFEIPVISVGNITVGGTGKTPATEYFVRLLKDNYIVAVLSRGYKRKTKGFFLADSSSKAETIGDEPYQIKQKYPDIILAVDEKRVHGIKKLQEINPNIDVIILDDAFQHRHVKPGLSVLLIDYTQPFFEDSFLPYGRLRDSPNEKHRANIILVTKAPEKIDPIDMRIMATNLELKAYQTLYFSTIKYKALFPVFGLNNEVVEIQNLKNHVVLLVTGIGNNIPILSYCKEKVKDVIILKFKDHRKYSKKDCKLISERFNAIDSENKIILTTEKDAVKLKNLSFDNNVIQNNMFYCPIEFDILNNEKEELDKQIVNYVNRDKGQYHFLTSKRQY